MHKYNGKYLIQLLFFNFIDYTVLSIFKILLDNNGIELGFVRNIKRRRDKLYFFFINYFLIKLSFKQLFTKFIFVYYLGLFRFISIKSCVGEITRN